MADYIPHGIDEFAVWLNNFGIQIGAHGAAVGATPAEIAEFQTAASRFAAELTAVVTAKNAYRASLAVRDDDREETIEPSIRTFVQRIQHAPGMTDEIRRDLGITVPDDQPTPQGDTDIKEAGQPLVAIDISQPKRATIKFGKNPNNAHQNALPTGIRGVRLWYWLGSGEPPKEEDWVFLDDDNRSPYTHVTMNSEPMTITYRAAYVDRHNRVGAPSEPVTVTINP